MILNVKMISVRNVIEMENVLNAQKINILVKHVNMNVRIVQKVHVILMMENV